MQPLQDLYQTCDITLFSCEPQKYEEVAKEEAWRQAMDEEIKMIKKNHIWGLIERLRDEDFIGLKWVYNIKYNEDETIQKYKTWLDTKEYSQHLGINFNKTFIPVMCMETIRMILVLVVQLKF